MKQVLKNIQDYIRYYFWILKGCPIPVDHVFKRKRIRKIAKQYSCETFVETGTFYGQMVEAVRNFFTIVLSVELSQSLYEYNKRKYSKCKNVHLYLGDSGILMGEMMKIISGRGLFWLDGHYSGPGTAKGDAECPVMVELNTIQKHYRNDHCILIDDARCFDGSHDYPDFSEVKRKLLKINPNYNIAIDYDCIIALPPAVGQ